MGKLVLSHLGCHPNELVLRNRALPWYSEWDILRKGFIMTFSFADGFDCIDEVLQEVKAVIFGIPQDPLDLIQPDWTTQLSHALESYNVISEEEYEDPRNINIPKTESHGEVEGLQG